jgi:hypothetical protein
MLENESFWAHNAVGLVALIISALTFCIVFAQMRIASSKVKLDLYDRRFEIYQAALELYQAIWDWKWEAIQPLEHRFIHAFRESQFLFDEKDGVYQTLEQIKDCNAKITADQKARAGKDDIGGDPDAISQYRRLLTGAAGKASIDFDKLLQQLEKQLKKYLDFRNIDGWSLRGSR